MENIQNAVNSMPHGSITQIARDLGVSRVTVYNVLNNIDNYDGDIEVYKKVIQEATKVLKDRAKKMQAAKDPFIKALQGCKI
jgi:peptidoglycan hydrolase CwlO-like protein